MSKLHRALAPAALGMLLSLSGCTGVGPHNWSHVDTNQYDSAQMPSGHRSPMLADAQYEEQLEQTRSRGMLARGVLREHWNRARGYEEAGHTEQAAAQYHQILRIKPDYAPAHHRLGVIATMVGRFNDADQHFRLARMINKQEPTEEEMYAEQNPTSEQEADAQIQREIAAEQGQHRQAGSKLASKLRSPLGASETDPYHAQEGEAPAEVAVASQRPLRQMRTAIRSRATEITAPITAAVKSRTPAMLRPFAKPEAEYAAEPAEQYAANEYEQVVEETLAEDDASQLQLEAQHSSRRPVTRPTVRPTASSARRSTSQAPVDRSAEPRKSSVRPAQPRTVQPAVQPAVETESDWLAGEEGEEPEQQRAMAPANKIGTSGIRRTSSQEPDSFATEQRDYAASLEQANLVRDREIAARAELLEAEVEANVEMEVETSLATQRIHVAREKLRRAQQQLVEAMVAAEGAGATTGNSPVRTRSVPAAQPAVPVSETQNTVPAPRRLKIRPTAALISPDGYEQCDLVEEETTELAETAEEMPADDFVQMNEIRQPSSIHANFAAANLPADVSGVMPTVRRQQQHAVDAQPEIIRTSHAEAVMGDSASSASEYEAIQESDEHAAVPQRQAIPKSLDEQTLHRREVSPHPAFIKKAPTLPHTMIYR